MNLTVKEVLERYGPALAMIAALIGLVVFIPGNASRTELSADASTSGDVASPDLIDTGEPDLITADDGTGTQTTTASTTGGSGGTTPASEAPGETAPQSTAPQASGPIGPGNWPSPGPETECRPDGKMPGFSQYAPLCFPVFNGDNGGATSQGVTGDTIKIVWYNDQTNAATQAALVGAGAGDTDATIRNDIQNFIRYFNLHTETWGREIVLEEFQGSGDPTDDNVLRADAVQIANNMKPFAVFHHSVAISSAFSEELAAKGIICMCTTSSARSFYTDNAPYAYSILPTMDEYFTIISEYIGKRLRTDPAKYAGTNLKVSNDSRKYGLIYLVGSGNDVNPRIEPVVDHFKQELAQYGIELSHSVAYQYDIAAASGQGSNIMGQMISKGVNHIIFIGDPLTPIVYTQEADKQQYFPEWMVTGFGLTDTSFFGRVYSQTQWTHAFGLSPLWVFAPLSKSSGYAAYHHINTSGTKQGVGVNVTQSPIQTLANGIQYAGPTLTAENFREGLFAAPAVGGTINAPLVKFTPENPAALKDWVEVWWDGNRSGKDEQDRQGRGMLVKANNGARYQPGQLPQQPPFVFGSDPAPITTTDKAEILPHGEDGHTHADDPPCRSCG